MNIERLRPTFTLLGTLAALISIIATVNLILFINLYQSQPGVWRLATFALSLLAFFAYACSLRFGLSNTTSRKIVGYTGLALWFLLSLDIFSSFWR